MGVRLREVPAAMGAAWVCEALETFRQRPGLYLSAFGALTLLTLLLGLLGLVGQLLFGAMVPLSSLVFMMIVAWSIADRPEHRRLAATPFEPTPARRRGLAGLSALYCTGMLVVSVVAGLAAGDSMEPYVEAVRAYTVAGDMHAEMPAPPPQLLGAMGLLYGGLALLSMALWHAPALVHWGGQGAAQALFSSLVAVWRTRGALAVYFLGWLGLGFIVMAVASVLVIVGLGVLALPLFFSAMMALGATYYVSLYFTFTGTFELDD